MVFRLLSRPIVIRAKKQSLDHWPVEAMYDPMLLNVADGLQAIMLFRCASSDQTQTKCPLPEGRLDQPASASNVGNPPFATDAAPFTEDS